MKENELFNKCVANLSPEVEKEVNENIDKMLNKSIEERARELWENLPIIQEKYISTIEDALREQKKIDMKDLDVLTSYYFEQGVKQTIEKACEWLSKQGQDWWEGYGIPFTIEDFKKALEEE